MKRIVLIAAVTGLASFAAGHYSPAAAAKEYVTVEVPCPPEQAVVAAPLVAKKKVMKKKTVKKSVAKKVVKKAKKAVKKTVKKARAAVVRVIDPKKCYETIVIETPDPVVPKPVPPAVVVPPPAVVVPAPEPAPRAETDEEKCRRTGGWWRWFVPYCEYQAP